MKTSLNAGRYKVESTMGRMVMGRMVRTCAVALVVVLVAAPALGVSVEESDEGLREEKHMPIYSPKSRGSGPTFEVGDAPLIINPASRRGYQFFELETSSLALSLMNMDSYQQLAYRELGFLSPRAGGGGGSSLDGIIPHAVDEQKGRLLLGIHAFNPSTEPHVVVVDERRMEQNQDPIVARLRIPPSQQAMASGSGGSLITFGVKGISLFVDPATGRQKLLLAFSFGAIQTTPGTYVAQWDLEKAILGNQANDWGDWLSLYPDCNDQSLVGTVIGTQVGNVVDPTSGFRLFSQMPVGRSYSAPYAYLGCTGKTGMKAVRIRLLGPNGTPDFTETFQGPSGQESTAAFLDLGADRLHLVGRIAKYTENRVVEMWTYDMISGRLVGKVGVTNEGDPSSFGMDPHTGRIYALAPNVVVEIPSRPFIRGGLVIIDGRLTPVPQALVFPQYFGIGAVPIVIDPPAPGRPRRVFFRRGHTEPNYSHPNAKPYTTYCPLPPDGRGGQCLSDDDWVVLQDRIPAPQPPDPADLDRYTVNVAEQEGLTGSSFEGSGGAYAARLKLVRGFAGVWSQGPSDSVWTTTGPPTCWADDRVITVASVEEAKLNSYQSTGKASPALADGATHRDLAGPASQCQPPTRPHELAGGGVPIPTNNPNVVAVTDLINNALKPIGGLGVPNLNSTVDPVIKSIDGALGQNWPAESAQCLTEGDEVKQFPSPFASKASVTCRINETRADARASIDLAGIVHVADSGSLVTVRRDASRGVEVRSEAWLSGVSIDLGDTTLSIDKVRALSVVWSNGRPSAAPRGKYVRTICGVRTGDGDPTPCYQEAITSAACKNPLPHPDHQAYCSDSTAFFVAGINRALGVRGSARLYTPDFRYVKGSPGGYVVAVQKSVPDQYEDAVRNGDYSWELPALEIVVERLSGRHVISLAAIKAGATYGIYQLPKELAFSSDFDGGNGIEQAYLGFDSPDSAFGGGVLASPSMGADERPGYGSGGSLIKRFFQGLLQRALLFRSLKEGVLAAAVWLSLLLPAVLVTRRMAVLRSIGLGS